MHLLKQSDVFIDRIDILEYTLNFLFRKILKKTTFKIISFKMTHEYSTFTLQLFNTFVRFF